MLEVTGRRPEAVKSTAELVTEAGGEGAEVPGWYLEPLELVISNQVN